MGPGKYSLGENVRILCSDQFPRIWGWRTERKKNLELIHGEPAAINNDLINLLNSVEIPIVILDVRRRIRHFTPNAQRILNLLPGDLGRSIIDLKLAIALEKLDEKIGEVIDAVTIRESEVQDAKGRWYRMQIRPFNTMEQKIYGVILSLEDITSRKEIERERGDFLRQVQEAKAKAEEANQAKDLFIAILSHELRTPLTSLLLQAQMLGRGKMDEGRVKHACKVIENSAKVQVRLIEDLLDISRISTGKLQMNQQMVALHEVVRVAADTVRIFAEKKAVVVEANIEDLPGRVSGDSTRLKQVVWNLLTNAIKFSYKGSKVILTLKAMNGWAQIQVIDEGIGIEPEFLSEVFDRFKQAEGSLARNFGGLGLGLAIVRHIVELHEGSVSVESLGKNKGTTFTVMLPILGEAAFNL